MKNEDFRPIFIAMVNMAASTSRECMAREEWKVAAILNKVASDLMGAMRDALGVKAKEQLEMMIGFNLEEEIQILNKKNEEMEKSSNL